MILFESERLYVRHFVMEDLQNFFLVNGDEEVMRYIRAPKTYPETAVFLQEVINRYKPGSLDLRLALMRKEDDAFIGSFAIIPVDHSTDTQLGYALLKEFWGKGYATEITRAGIQYVSQNLNLPFILAITEKVNTPSQKVLMKAGFQLFQEGTKEDKDICVFRIKLRENS